MTADLGVGLAKKRCQVATRVAETNRRGGHLKLARKTLAKCPIEIDDTGPLTHKGVRKQTLDSIRSPG